MDSRTPEERFEAERATDTRCVAEAVGALRTYGTETHRCEKEAGHDGAHETRRNNRTVLWFGPARKAEFNTNWRYGLRPGWLNNEGNALDLPKLTEADFEESLEADFSVGE